MEVTSDFPMEEAMKNVFGLVFMFLVLAFATGSTVAAKGKPVSTGTTYILVVVPTEGPATVVHRVGEKGESTFFAQKKDESVPEFFERVVSDPNQGR